MYPAARNAPWANCHYRRRYRISVQASDPVTTLRSWPAGAGADGGHRPLDRFQLLGRERDHRLALVELLHVHAGVVAALDRAEDDAGAARVEQRDRGRLPSAGAVVRVVTDDRRARERRVGAPVDAGDRRRDLVHGAVEIVDASLERDGEVGEVPIRPAEEHLLRGAQPAEIAEEQRRRARARDGAAAAAPIAIQPATVVEMLTPALAATRARR